MDIDLTSMFRLMHSDGMFLPFMQFEADDDDRFQKLKTTISARKYGPKNTGKTYRVLNHWSEKGLLRSGRDRDQQGWRKFSVSDLVWIRLLNELRAFGMSIDQLKNAYQSTFHAPNGNPWGWFDFWIARCMQGDPVKVIVFNDGHAEYLHHLEFEANELLRLTDHLSFVNVSLNACYMSATGRGVENLPEIPFKINLSSEELELIEKIRAGDLTEIQVQLKDGSIKELRSIVSAKFDPEIFISQIEHGELSINFQDGKPVFTKTTSKNRF